MEITVTIDKNLFYLNQFCLDGRSDLRLGKCMSVLNTISVSEIEQKSMIFTETSAPSPSILAFARLSVTQNSSHNVGDVINIQITATAWDATDKFTQKDSSSAAARIVTGLAGLAIGC